MKKRVDVLLIYACIIILYVWFFPAVKSQNIHFSNLYLTHLTLNPANIGSFDGDLRAVAMYRAQGYNLGVPYQTFYTSFEKPFFPFDEQIDVGIYYSHDDAGEYNFPAHYLFANIAKRVSVTRTVAITAGLQIGYVSKSFNSLNETYPDQYSRETGSFDRNLPTAEQFDINTSSNVSAGMGFLVTKTFSESVLNVGYSAQNLNKPSETFFGEENQTDVRNVFHTKFEYSISEFIFTTPAFVLVAQGKSRQTLIGSNVGYRINANKSIRNIQGGLFLRNGILNNFESIIFGFGIDFSKWKFFSSYDFDISGLKSNYSANTGIEFGLVYILPNSSLREIIHPTERF
ncbi:PorP/SprF family type IX secretion system membrane protein [Carboxylicivirga caseinilyticus]|uniref:PorP/SprF family type IX secretion system membrane protein n=1 Tax=Carboxylicivirga caseinilyticus TaxID=3417572 RepID=UPI003D34801B|nr:PorP/SprF family type IX secretion system membrane protein [Marinilabiliaceae bacterium A049]